MWRKLKFVHTCINFKFLHMTDVEKSEISFIMCTNCGILLHFTLFCFKISFFFVNLRCFVAKSGFPIYALLCGKNLAKNSARGEKMTNIRYAPAQLLDPPCSGSFFVFVFGFVFFLLFVFFVFTCIIVEHPLCSGILGLPPHRSYLKLRKVF